VSVGLIKQAADVSPVGPPTPRIGGSVAQIGPLRPSWTPRRHARISSTSRPPASASSHAADLSRVSATLLRAVRNGLDLQIRPRTSARILAIPLKPPLHAIVSAVVTWRYIRLLRKDGFSDADIARAIGLRRPMLELHPKRVRLKTHIRILRLYRERVSEHTAHDHDEAEEALDQRPGA
jgi:hypothetical protein